MPNSSPRSVKRVRLVGLLLLISFISVGIAVSVLVQPSSAITNGGSITTLGTPLTENFDTLASTGTGLTWTDNSTIPGWYSNRTTYNSGTGSSNTGALYSFGVAGTNPVTDRALGTVASGGTLTIYQAVRLTNNTGWAITSLDISYVGEQWRNGGNTTAHTLTFQYQVANAGTITGANAPTTGWTTFSPLSFTGPIATATAAALDGNAPANRIAKSATLSVTVNDGQEVWLRWQDPDDSGNDHGLAIDDFSVTASAGGTPTPTPTPTPVPSSTPTPTPTPTPSPTPTPTPTPTPIPTPTPTPLVVISQIYGGGGNSGAIYKNDYIEIFNRGTNTVNLNGWSVQYSSANGTSWTNKTTLSGSLAPGQYYLIKEAAGTTGDGADLPPADATGSINMSATDGKVALVSNNTSLAGGCPLGGASVIDFIGYGAPSCFEGAGPAPGLDNTSADFRTHNGCKDTDSNGGNFVVGSPAPRNTSSPTTSCPTGDFPPEIFGTSPAANEAHIAQDANITINFDEPVNVAGTWYQISCANTGIHSAGVTGGPVSFTLNPDSDFGYNEQCTVTIFAAQVTDQDVDDPPDNLEADYVFTFNSEFFRDPAEHMVMGNPSNATSDPGNSTNFLMMKIQYALSYNDSRGAPNWTSWHLDSTWRGSAPRQDNFRADTSLPPGYHQVQGGDFSGSGFDRGHMCPSADRTSTIADNSATFLMTNMIAQAPDNNQGPWAAYENYLRTFLPGNEIYIISGGTGTGGTGSNGSANTIAGGFVNVPAVTWKVALILPVGDDDILRVDGNTRTIAVIMPNVQGIRFDQWQKYLATVDQVESLSGYDFYSNVSPAIQDVFEAKLDAANDTAPTTADQNKTTAEDESVAVTLSASDFNVNNAFTFTIVDQPSNGSVLCAAANCTYSPEAHFFGADQFTYKANDGALDSNVSTVFINVTEVNNTPVTVNDSKNTAEDSSLNFPASDLTSNDSPGPNESGQTLTVDSVISTPDTHGSLVLNAGQISYTPEANYNGPASFDYHVCDNGTTNGSPDSKCATGTVNVTVTEVNDDPSATDDSKSTNEDTNLNFPASDLTGNDSAGPANENNQTLTVTSVAPTGNTHGTVSLNAGQISYAPAANYNGMASFNYQVCDDGTSNGASDVKCANAVVTVTVNAVQDPPDAVDDPVTIAEDSGANSINVLGNDSDADGDTITVTAVTQGAHGSVAITGGGTGVSYTPAVNFFGTDSFTYSIGDGHGNSDTATVNITVNNVNDPPVANNDNYATNSNTTLNVAAPGVLSNDTDIDSSTLTSVLVAGSGPSHGSLTLNSNGSFSYTPTLDYTGSDSFSYRAFDSADSSNPATVTIAVNDTVPPVINSSRAVSLITSTNSNLINVGLNASATDNSGGPVNIQVAVFGDEDDQTPTTNNAVHSPDAKDIGPNNTLRLRGERLESGDGRVYLIIITATDLSGNVSRAYHTVVVPKGNKQANIDSVNAQAAAAVSYAQSHAGAPPVGYFVIGDGPIIGPKQ